MERIEEEVELSQTDKQMCLHHQCVLLLLTVYLLVK